MIILKTADDEVIEILEDLGIYRENVKLEYGDEYFMPLNSPDTLPTGIEESREIRDGYLIDTTVYEFPDDDEIIRFVTEKNRKATPITKEVVNSDGETVLKIKVHVEYNVYGAEIDESMVTKLIINGFALAYTETVDSETHVLTAYRRLD